MLIVSIMVSASAFVVTFDTPPMGSGEAWESLEVKAEDALAILHDTPIDSRFGDDALSAYIAECLNSQCDNLSTHLGRLVPDGASYALYISNGHDTYPVLLEGLPQGEAVTAQQTFEPRWSSTFVATATESVAPDDALLVYALPIFHSNPVTPGGSQLLVKLSGSRADGSDYVLIGSYSTVAYGTDDLEATAASLYFVNSTGAPLAVHELTDALDTPRRLTLRLEETQDASIPAGTEVAVHVPRGFSAIAPQADNPTWTILANATDWNGSSVGSTVRANLTSALRDGYADLAIDVTYHGDVLDYYPFVATLSNGATSTASVLVRGEEHESDPALATPMLQLSVPSPMGRGAPTTWTLSAYVPVSDGAVGGLLPQTVEVNSIEIAEKEGYDIFGCGGTPPIVELTTDGEWTCAADRLVWTGTKSLHYGDLLNLSFQVRASGTAGPVDVRSQFVPPVEFDEWTGRLVERTGWGFYKQAILPEDSSYSGFDKTVASDHLVRSDGPYRATALPGSATYNVSALGAVQDSLYGSYVTAASRNVPVGGEVVINANVQSVLFTLAEIGQRAGVTLRFYPPWSGDARVPIYEQENLDQGILSGEVTHMVVLDVNSDGAPDPIVGTTNGRVLAFHGLTGQRLQGNAFTPPLLDNVTNVSGTTSVTAMELIEFEGAEYIVVGFDQNAVASVYVLNSDLESTWVGDTPGAVSAFDTNADIDGDGERDIVVAQSYEQSLTNHARVWALKMTGASSTLQRIDTRFDQDVMADVLGTPTAVATQQRAGPFGSTTGVLVPVQTLLEPGIEIDLGVFPPSLTKGASSTPRAGVVAANRFGEETSTLFGAPASVMRSYDYGGDEVDDVVFGGTSGYVIMSNGTVLTQPIYSYVVVNTAYVDGDTRTSAESYVLTTDGTVLFTDDGWITTYGTSTQFPGAKAVDTNWSGHFWVVGPANGIWRTTDPAASPPDPTHARHPVARDFGPLALLSGTRNGLSYSFVSHIHEFRDVHADVDDITIVGTKCALLVTCDEGLVLRSTDGGDNWNVLTVDDGSLVSSSGGAVTQDLNRIEFIDGTGWIAGDGGTLLRSDDGGATWDGIASGTTYDLLDIDCKPSDPDTCMVVGEAGAAFRVTGATGGSPSWENLTATEGLPSDRTLYSVGYVEDDRVYIGSQNMVLASFWGANFTTLPLNYVENDARVISTNGDGAGFVYGGGGSVLNARTWLLHDYHTQSRAVTTSYADEFPADARIVTVSLSDGNVTIGQQTIEVNVTRGAEWKRMGTLSEGAEDPREPSMAGFATFDIGTLGRDLRFNITMNTTGDKTILSPHVRWLDFTVEYAYGENGAQSGEKTIRVDFRDTTKRDATLTTADWNDTIDALRQPLVREYWTRNVSGQVYDLRSGFDVTGDAREDIWIATGNIVAENSPDHILYAGTNLSRVVGSDDRVYLLDGRNGDPARISDKLNGEVRNIRLVDQDDNAWPEVLFATTWNDTAEAGTLYALNATTLATLWTTDLGLELPSDLEVGRFTGDHRAAFVGTQRPPAVATATGHLWGVNESTHLNEWRVVPDDMGKYLVIADVPEGWLFGPYVVEIEVEWEETVTTEGEVGQNVLRSARFYDHFMVTPPDALSPPAPVYTAKLLVWMRDWG